MSNRSEYIIGARDPASKQAHLQRFLDAIAGRGDTRVVSADTSKPLVVDMPETAAAELQALMGKDLIIEKNALLRY